MIRQIPHGNDEHDPEAEYEPRSDAESCRNLDAHHRWCRVPHRRPSAVSACHSGKHLLRSERIRESARPKNCGYRVRTLVCGANRYDPHVPSG